MAQWECKVRFEIAREAPASRCHVTSRHAIVASTVLEPPSDGRHPRDQRRTKAFSFSVQGGVPLYSSFFFFLYTRSEGSSVYCENAASGLVRASNYGQR